MPLSLSELNDYQIQSELTYALRLKCLNLMVKTLASFSQKKIFNILKPFKESFFRFKQLFELIYINEINFWNLIERFFCLSNDFLSLSKFPKYTIDIFH